MSPVPAPNFTPRELATLRLVIAPPHPEATTAPDLGRAVVAAQILWRSRAGGLSRFAAG